jgi:peptidoglycan/LPS O-acetylase OafA/YrhL
MMATTKHFRVLDGLRGVAAIAAAAYHFGDRSDMPALMPRGYLAVDFFFVLSGLVIAHAYLDRLRRTLSMSRFVVQRAIRLGPMLAPGTLLGAAMEIWRPNAGDPLTHFVAVAFTAVLGCLAIPWPFPTTMEQTIFPINGPVWSLFFEIVANLVFAAVATSSRARPLFRGLAAGGAIGLAGIVIASGRLDVGPLIGNWLGGFPRVIFSFFAGVLLSTQLRRLPALPAWISPAVLLAVFMTPRAIPETHNITDGVFDLAIVLAVFPLIVGSAANSACGGRVARLCDLAGDLSYPFYAIHYPIVRAICFVLMKHPLPVAARLGICALTLALVGALSWLALRWYDRPIRRALTRRFAASPDPRQAGIDPRAPAPLERPTDRCAPPTRVNSCDDTSYRPRPDIPGKIAADWLGRHTP